MDNDTTNWNEKTALYATSFIIDEVLHYGSKNWHLILYSEITWNTLRFTQLGQYRIKRGICTSLQILSNSRWKSIVC